MLWHPLSALPPVLWHSSWGVSLDAYSPTQIQTQPGWADHFHWQDHSDSCQDCQESGTTPITVLVPHRSPSPIPPNVCSATCLNSSLSLHTRHCAINRLSISFSRLRHSGGCRFSSSSISPCLASRGKSLSIFLTRRPHFILLNYKRDNAWTGLGGRMRWNKMPLMEMHQSDIFMYIEDGSQVLIRVFMLGKCIITVQNKAFVQVMWIHWAYSVCL